MRSSSGPEIRFDIWLQQQEHGAGLERIAVESARARLYTIIRVYCVRDKENELLFQRDTFEEVTY